MLSFLVARLQNKKGNCGQRSTHGPPSVCGEQAEAGWRLEGSPMYRTGEAVLEWQHHRAGAGGCRGEAWEWTERANWPKALRNTGLGGWKSSLSDPCDGVVSVSPPVK